MAAPIHITTDWNHQSYDMIIDVRSPSEFADDHIEGAVNMPVLSDDERIEIGTIYKQDSAYSARKAGAVLVARNIAHHIETKLSDKPVCFTPLIYCWRGGQRSHAFAQICSEIGWCNFILQGGYKTYRRDILSCLNRLPQTLDMIIISGHTGSGKTALLQALMAQSAQIIDLEALAKHRGSLLGKIEGRQQPSQRRFESSLVKQMRDCQNDKPVFIEAESAHIGNIHIPQGFWRQMNAANVISLSVPHHQRADYLLSIYQHLCTDGHDLEKLISGMKWRHGREKTTKWAELKAKKAWHELACQLLDDHYDPAYDKSVKRREQSVLFSLEQADCKEKTLNQTASLILARLAKNITDSNKNHLHLSDDDI